MSFHSGKSEPERVLVHKKWTLALAALGILRERPLLTAKQHDEMESARGPTTKTNG